LVLLLLLLLLLGLLAWSRRHACKSGYAACFWGPAGIHVIQWHTGGATNQLK
jgi:hypothetical protein